MARQLFEVFQRDQVTDAMLEEAASLFNDNYGVWGLHPAESQRAPRQGSRVKLGKRRLQTQYLPENIDCSYVRVTVDGHLAGNAFACRWQVQGKNICWITQLVIRHQYRQRGLAVSLLNCLRRDDDDVYGIMSSHPAACLAATTAFRGGGSIDSAPKSFIRENANLIMKQSPIEYIRNAELRGSLFRPDDVTGAVSSVWTNFFVDHAEPLEALDSIRKVVNWPLGDLFGGHEFLLLVEARLRNRLRSRSTSLPSA